MVILHWIITGALNVSAVPFLTSRSTHRFYFRQAGKGSLYLDCLNFMFASKAYAFSANGMSTYFHIPSTIPYLIHRLKLSVWPRKCTILPTSFLERLPGHR